MTLSSTSSRGTAQVFPTSVWIDPYVTPKNQGGWTARPTSALFLNGFAAQSSFTAPPPGDYIEWDMLMASGTWALSVIGEKNTNLGIATVTIDGVSAGTIDFYGDGAFSGSFTFPDLTGIAIAADGVHTLRLQMASKNASSSSYGGYLQAIGLRRTGA